MKFAAAILICLFSVCLDASAQWPPKGIAQATTSNGAPGSGGPVIVKSVAENGTVCVTGFYANSNLTTHGCGIPYFPTREAALLVYPPEPCVQQPDVVYNSGPPYYKITVTPGACTTNPLLVGYILPPGL